ncbi:MULTISPECIES: hypothetical protein [Paraburkholderia]|uniref:hypothetical protein n=1 Tax=Paraburkholderia TaxID=1822464 RepID=UPI00225B6CA4|nr:MULTISPECIES: hypothetical protein [Paraburkholderia]MCX4177381.1 hypothetical protein [Paraburkholderia madseniana]MDQ6465369.1 hypothetical protein [Paraburkholderia madseniana]
MKSTIAGTAIMTSPYTSKNIDEAIVHLERVLAIDGATRVLGQHYWQTRVTQIGATSGLTPGQRARVARLPKLLESATEAQCQK